MPADAADKLLGSSHRNRQAFRRCQRCEWQSICHQGCPKHRHDRYRRFEDLDYFCQAYKMIYARAAGPLTDDLRKLYGNSLHPSTHVGP